jgi:hypothetical protein
VQAEAAEEAQQQRSRPQQQRHLALSVSILLLPLPASCWVDLLRRRCPRVLLAKLLVQVHNLLVRGELPPDEASVPMAPARQSSKWRGCWPVQQQWQEVRHQHKQQQHTTAPCCSHHAWDCTQTASPQSESWRAGPDRAAPSPKRWHRS